MLSCHVNGVRDLIHSKCCRQGKASFGDSGVFVEKYVQRARHIEVQIFGGTARAPLSTLPERECSIQRRPPEGCRGDSLALCGWVQRTACTSCHNATTVITAMWRLAGHAARTKRAACYPEGYFLAELSAEMTSDWVCCAA